MIFKEALNRGQNNQYGRSYAPFGPQIFDCKNYIWQKKKLELFENQINFMRLYQSFRTKLLCLCNIRTDYHNQSYHV